MRTFAYTVTYKGRNNSDYDGEQVCWNLLDCQTAEDCVSELLESNDWDADAFTIQARELTLLEINQLALEGDEDAQDYFYQLLCIEKGLPVDTELGRLYSELVH